MRISPPGGVEATKPQTGGTIEEFEDDSSPNYTNVNFGAANVWGAWAQVIAAVPADVMVCSLMIELGVAVTETFRIQLATGAGGSEVPIAQWTFATQAHSAVGMGICQQLVLPTPIAVPNGTRLALHGARSAGAGGDAFISVQWYVDY